MNNFVKKSSIALVALLVTITGMAQEPAIKGYFRVKNVGNDNYVEVTGPFTAKPNLTYSEAEHSAGTVMYVEAVQDRDSYRLTHLRCQGIDVADDCIDPDEYDKIIGDLEGNLNGDLAYSLVRQGFKYGYTSIARATVGTVFWFVAGKLQGYVGDDDKNGTGDSGYKYYKDDYIEVARDFNREVTANLDLGIRLLPVSFEDKTVQVYFDVPSLQPVCDWYLDKDAKLFAGTSDAVSRHDVFASAMRSMSLYLASKDINLETFTAADIKLFADWQYDITSKYPANDNGEIELTFDKIFSDPVLLFNWIKMVGYYVLNPGDNDHNLSSLGYSDLADKAQNHYLTKLFVDYLPRIHYNSRAYLIDGRITNGGWDNSESGTLGFASQHEMTAAGTHGVWALCPIDNENQKFVIDHQHKDVVKETTASSEAFATSALYFDFPVKAADANTTFYTLSDELYCAFIYGYEYLYTYNKVIKLDNEIPALTPFLMKTVTEDNSQLLVGDGLFTFEEIDYTSDEDIIPDNSIVVGDDETIHQYALITPFYLSSDENSALKGVLLPTSLINSDMTNLWNEDKKIYSYNMLEDRNVSHVAFSTPPTGKTELAANEVVYIPNQTEEDYKSATYVSQEQAIKDLEDSFVYIGSPVGGMTSGIVGIAVDKDNNDKTLYNLMGQPVANPIPGTVYILKGKKILIK